MQFTPDGKVFLRSPKRTTTSLSGHVDSHEANRAPYPEEGISVPIRFKFLPDGETLSCRGKQERRPNASCGIGARPMFPPLTLDGSWPPRFCVTIGRDHLLCESSESLTSGAKPTRATSAKVLSYNSPTKCTIEAIAFSQPSGEYLATTDRSGQDSNLGSTRDRTSWARQSVDDPPSNSPHLCQLPRVFARWSIPGLGQPQRKCPGLARVSPHATGASSPSGRCKGHAEKITSIAFSHNGRWIVTGSDDHTVRLWPGRAPSVDRDTVKADDWIYTVNFSPV